MSFATGRHALAECERCGEEVRYGELQEEYERGIRKGNLVCRKCYDKDHPQNWAGQYAIIDPEGLLDPRPPRNLKESRSLCGWGPVGAPGNRMRMLSSSVWWAIPIGDSAILISWDDDDEILWDEGYSLSWEGDS